MVTVLAMPGFDGKWDDICDITAKMLSSGRKSVAIAAAQLLTGFLQVCIALTNSDFCTLRLVSDKLCAGSLYW